jgi:hypothetical protein
MPVYFNILEYLWYIYDVVNRATCRHVYWRRRELYTKFACNDVLVARNEPTTIIKFTPDDVCVVTIA